MTRIQSIAALAIALLAPLAAAEWKGKGELGVVMARGNSEADTVNAKLDMAEESERWKNGFGIAALRASNDGEKNAERYNAFWQTDYKFSDRSYWYGGLRYEDDRFSGFDYQASLTTGIGHKFIDTETTKLSGQAGAGYRRLKNAVTGKEFDNAIFGGELKYEHTLTETTKLVDKFVIEAGSENTFMSNELAVQVKMTDSLSLAAGLGVRYNTDPPAGRKKTDTLTTLNIVYGF